MSSLPASQPAEDGEADGATAPPTVDPSSEEPPVTYGGVRKSVGSPLIGAQPNGESVRLSESLIESLIGSAGSVSESIAARTLIQRNRSLITNGRIGSWGVPGWITSPG